MAQDVSAKRVDFATQLTTAAADILALKRKLDELNSAYFANAFNSGAANAFTQAHLDGTVVLQHLTPTAIGDVITTIQALQTALTQGHMDNLRKAVRTAL